MIWKEIPLWTRYSVSDSGLVRNNKTGRILKPGTNTGGYKFVILCVRNVKRETSVHALVAECFIGPRPFGLHINHKNGIKTDNSAFNLEYVSPQENNAHARATGLWVEPQKKFFDPVLQKCSREKTSSQLTGLTIAEGLLIERLCSKPGHVFSRDELALAYGRGGRTIDQAICRIRRKLGVDYIRTVTTFGYAVTEPSRI